MVILFWIVLCGRLFSIQIFQGDEHGKKLVAQAHRKESIPAERGNIFDFQKKKYVSKEIEYYENIYQKKDSLKGSIYLNSQKKQQRL